MYKFYLDGTEVRQPIGFENLVFEKTRSGLFGGFVYGTYGYIQGFKNLTFYEAVARDIIRDAIKEKGLKAEIYFECTYCSKLVFLGRVDVLSVEFDDLNRVSVGVTDSSDADKLMSRARIDYAIEPTRSVLLHAKELPSVANFVIEREIQFLRKGISGGFQFDCSHYVPFSVSGSELQGATSVSFSGLQLYESDSNGQIGINGVLKWSSESEQSLAYKLVLYVVDGGNRVKYTRVIGQYVANEVETTETAVVNEVVSVSYRDRVELKIEGGASSGFKFLYMPESYLGIGEKVVGESSECVGLTLYEAFTQLVAKMTEGTVVFESALLRNSGDFVTSGENIRGLKKSVNVSLAFLFENLAKMMPVEASLEDGVFRIEKKGSRKRTVDIDEVLEYKEAIDTSRVYSGVKVGYKNWQAEAKWKDDEFNSTRDYATEVVNNSSVLDLTNEFITGGYLIEETRQRQLSDKTKNEEWKYDTNIFLIKLNEDFTAAERYENISIRNVVDAGSVYNIDYSPVRVLNNFRQEMPYTNLEFTSGTGNTLMESDGIRENMKLNFELPKLPYIATFKKRMDVELFDSVRDWVSFWSCGKEREARVEGIGWSIDAQGQGWGEFAVSFFE